jgi:hypothetical protein
MKAKNVTVKCNVATGRLVVFSPTVSIAKLNKETEVFVATEGLVYKHVVMVDWIPMKTAILLRKVHHRILAVMQKLVHFYLRGSRVTMVVNAMELVSVCVVPLEFHQYQRFK